MDMIYTASAGAGEKLPKWDVLEWHEAPDTPEHIEQPTNEQYLDSKSDWYRKYKKKYLCIIPDANGEHAYKILEWCNGWNCLWVKDAARDWFYVMRKYEFENVIAWAELPELR